MNTKKNDIKVDNSFRVKFKTFTNTQNSFLYLMKYKILTNVAKTYKIEFIIFIMLIKSESSSKEEYFKNK